MSSVSDGQRKTRPLQRSGSLHYQGHVNYGRGDVVACLFFLVGQCISQRELFEAVMRTKPNMYIIGDRAMTLIWTDEPTAAKDTRHR